jgi:hypothetical protein
MTCEDCQKKMYLDTFIILNGILCFVWDCEACDNIYYEEHLTYSKEKHD